MPSAPRPVRVAELIRRELGMILEKDFSFHGALVTVHDVQLPPDMKQCFIWVGVLGKESDKEKALEKLTSSRGAIQRALYKRVILKNSPQLFFRLDDSVERGVRVLNIIDSLPPPAEEDDLQGDQAD
jgi:ribosome-binding factor A